MNNYLPLLQTTTLFAGLSAAELSTLLSRLGASMTDYGAPSARGQPLFRLLTPEDAVLTEESTPTWGEMQL